MRRLVLVDIENVVGGAARDSRSVLWARREVAEAVSLRHDDHVVIGTSHTGLLATGTNWPNVRYVIGSGPDGADLVLLEVLEEGIADRFGEVVLISGDGIFADKMAELARRGLRTTVIAHSEGLAARLRLAAHRTTYLPYRYHPHYGDVAISRT